MNAPCEPKNKINALSCFLLTLQQFGENLLNIIFPIACHGCGQTDTWLCETCYKKIKTNKRQKCFVCGNTNLTGNYACGCLENFHFDGLYIAGDFKDSTLARLIKNYKYKFIRDLKIPLSRFLIDFIDIEIIDRNLNCDTTLSKRLADKNLTIIPVPIHRRRLRWRGFNQSAELAQIIADTYDIKINHDLIRRKFYQPQTKLDKIQRQKNIHNSFAWLGCKKAPRNVLLIDDVVTTGSTINECSRVLKENGTRNIQVLVIAKN